jgi:hypothetical protein
MLPTRIQGIEQQLYDVAELSGQQGFDWEFWFQHLPTGPVDPNNCTLYTVHRIRSIEVFSCP